MYGLSDALLTQIADAARRFRVSRLVLFGSRARGDYRDASDVDLAVYGLEPRDELPLRAALDDLPTLLRFDLVPVRQGLDAALAEQIRKDGVVLMENRVTKPQQLARALERLREAIAEYDRTHSSAVRDGAIQRFEFCAELAWKSCRERLLEEGYVDLDSPRAALRQAFAAGLVQDAQGWQALLQTRNLTSHLYSEQQADESYRGIVETYAGLMGQLSKRLEADAR